MSPVEVLNVITFGPKCNKVLNVITFGPRCNKVNWLESCVRCIRLSHLLVAFFACFRISKLAGNADFGHS